MDDKVDFKKKQERKFNAYMKGPVFGFIFYFFWFYIFSILTHIICRFVLSNEFESNKDFFLILLFCVPFNISFIALYFSRKFRKRISMRGAMTFSFLLLAGGFVMVDIYKDYGFYIFGE
jgi:hypothetical protein